MLSLVLVCVGNAQFSSCLFGKCSVWVDVYTSHIDPSPLFLGVETIVQDKIKPYMGTETRRNKQTQTEDGEGVGWSLRQTVVM